jgi:histidinol dehydrogenase
MKPTPLRRLGAEDIMRLARNPVDEAALAIARPIVDEVRAGGFDAAVAAGLRLGDLAPGKQVIFTPVDCLAALARLTCEQQSLLRRTAARIRRFANAQRSALSNIREPVPGGSAGHEAVPVERAGCYAPGGRFPLPSSVLMTAVTARAAGVATVWVASPRPSTMTLAAAAVAEADGLVALGGAQAIALLAYGGGEVPAADVVVGPGNAYVTAAKYLVSSAVGIDMLAGPSELVVVADERADSTTVAVDLLAQAEHDPDALPVLVALDEDTADRVELAVRTALAELPTAATAGAALANGYSVVVEGLEEAAAICNLLAPEHLQLSMAEPQSIRPLLRHYGALFLGSGACEVLGDYGIGPNHTLPTGGAARHSGGLSVFDFLRIRTWLEVDDLPAAAEVVADAEELAKLEGLAGHALAAGRRRG